MRRLLLALLLLGAGAALVARAGRLLLVADPLPGTASAIVMLAGSTADRVLEAAALFEAGVAPTIVLTRERDRAEVAALARRGVVLPASHEIARQALVDLGVPDDAIRTLARPAWSTVSEAAVIADWACSDEAVRRVVVVTSPSHTRRARAILRRGLGSRVDVRIRPTRDGDFPADRWWRHRHVAKRVLFEYQKLLAFWLVERWGLVPCDGA